MSYFKRGSELQLVFYIDIYCQIKYVTGESGVGIIFAAEIYPFLAQTVRTKLWTPNVQKGNFLSAFDRLS